MPGSTDVEDRFENSKDLEALLTQIIENVPECSEAADFRVGIMYSNKSLPKHRLAQVKRVGAAERFKSRIDYIVVVDKRRFDLAVPEEKLRGMLHEVHHIKPADKSDGRTLKPGLREHEADFCEIAEHDAYTRGLVERYMGRLPALKQLITQTQLDGK